MAMGEQEDKAFKRSKQLPLSSQLLVHFNPTNKIILAYDASAYGIGAVLPHQMSKGEEQPIGFVSCTYSQIEKALSCIFGINKFHTYLYGHKFTLITDHKPLLSLFKEHKVSLQRWALILTGYEYTIAFRPTATHSNADTLSHLPVQCQDKQVR